MYAILYMYSLVAIPKPAAGQFFGQFSAAWTGFARHQALTDRLPRNIHTFCMIHTRRILSTWIIVCKHACKQDKHKSCYMVVHKRYQGIFLAYCMSQLSQRSMTDARMRLASCSGLQVLHRTVGNAACSWRDQESPPQPKTCLRASARLPWTPSP